MPTVIRCKRGGRTHNPYYRIVVMDSRSRPKGPEIDTLGVYHPCARPEPLSQVDACKALDWLNKGARMSDTARSVLSKLGVLKHFHDGTRPEEELATLKAAAVVDKGYNAPPPPKEKPAPPKPEAPEAAAEEAPEAAVEEAPAATEEEAQAAETNDSAPEAAAPEEEKSE